ncbi:hypothetical protein [Serratia ureilytica]|uniref:hypothetical protein n=1 Tax=Serratia ureilytica TaxID=300181 RepID=UPI00313C47BC
MKKLSELSKPVAYIADCGTIVSDSDPFFDDYKNPQPIYSQEYVSALLAELEAKTLECRGIEQERGLFRVERTAHQQHAQELEKRIAELEINEKQMLRDHYCAEDVLARQRNDYESALEGMYEAVAGKRPAWGCGFGADEAVKEVAQIHAELEAKLATPVRLPTTSGRLGVAYTRVIPEVIEAIRAAGFTVEGDE